MDISLIILTLGGICMLLLLAGFVGNSLETFFHKKTWLARGIEAEALVLRVEETGLQVNKLPQVRFQLQVMPGNGRNFVVEFKEVIVDTEFSSLKAGSVVRVKYNPENIKELFLIRVA